MRKIVLGISVLFFAATMMAQNTKDYMEVERAALKTEKKAIVAAAMVFTEEESNAFWPLYNEYSEKKYVVNTKIYDNVIDFADNYETMTDEKAITIWTNSMKYSDELSKLQKTYFKHFLKILPGKKAARYFQVENKIKMLINAELALEIPLIEE